MSQYKTKADLYRAWADVLDMCKGTKVHINDCWKCNGSSFGDVPYFDNYPETYSFAIGIVEDKPVFVGDVLYTKDGEAKNAVASPQTRWRDFSWNPPKPKTVMVELLVEDAEWLTSGRCDSTIAIACRKALADRD